MKKISLNGTYFLCNCLSTCKILCLFIVRESQKSALFLGWVWSLVGLVVGGFGRWWFGRWWFGRWWFGRWWFGRWWVWSLVVWSLVGLVVGGLVVGGLWSFSVYSLDQRLSGVWSVRSVSIRQSLEVFS